MATEIARVQKQKKYEYIRIYIYIYECVHVYMCYVCICVYVLCVYMCVYVYMLCNKNVESSATVKPSNSQTEFHLVCLIGAYRTYAEVKLEALPG